ncbi:MAG: phosphodiester glycosidase family protein [Bacilli bacterium]|nr:phosphodiester glycosidase family protein [Bacilli bacterium]
MYGPISYFRNFWVTSAMSTMSHQYLAYIFFNQEQIDDILSQNTIIEVEGNTNEEEIKFEEPEEIIEYTSPEEEQILTRDPGNDLYKVIKVEGNGYKGHLLVVYDPSKLQLVQVSNLKYGKTIETFAREYGAVAGTNAGGFVYSKVYGYTPTGTVIIDGQLMNDGVGTGWGGGIIGFTNDNVLVLTKSSAQEALDMGIRDAVSFGPFLIVNGVASQFTGNGGYGVAPRTAIGQRKDGIVLLLVIDGRRPGHSIGVDMVELTNIMLKYGAYNASNLDGGGSSTIVANGETLSVGGGYGYTGDRYLHNAWLLIP